MKHGALVHGSTKLCELWHKHLVHLHYKTLPILKNVVQGFLDFKIEEEGVYKGYVVVKHIKVVFPNNEDRSRG